jgi:hypothetical protein
MDAPRGAKQPAAHGRASPPLAGAKLVARNALSQSKTPTSVSGFHIIEQLASICNAIHPKRKRGCVHTELQLRIDKFHAPCGCVESLT